MHGDLEFRIKGFFLFVFTILKIEVELIYNVSGGQHRDSVSYVHIYILFQILFKYKLLNSVQSLSSIQLFATPLTAACQAFLSITYSRSLHTLMSIELVTPSKHLILCHPLLLLPFSLSYRLVTGYCCCCCC